MTSGSPGKEPISQETINMIFNSSDLAKIWQSRDSVSSNTRSGGGGGGSANADLQKIFSSGDSAAALFKSAEFLKSLDAYKESLAKAGAFDENSADGAATADPSAFFKSVDFLKSLDSLKAGASGSSGGPADPAAFFKSMDFLKSLDSLPGQNSGKPAARKAAAKNAFTSQDWMEGYEPSHVDVNYKNNDLFKSGDKVSRAAPKMPARAPVAQSESVSKWMKLYEDSLSTSPAPAPTTTAAPAAAAWDNMYENVLSNPLQTASASASMPPLGAAKPTPVPSAVVSAADPAATKLTASGKPKKKRIYKSRKIIPENKVFVEFKDEDVLLGRGGLSNKHPGNKRYREEIENAKAVYRSASKDDKTKWASLLVEYVEKYGGRFLEKDKATGKWYIVPDIVARRKAGQALREDNTAESRAEKRERYKKRHALD